MILKKTVRQGFETVSYRSNFLWTNAPLDYKSQKQKLESGKLRFVNVGSATITSATINLQSVS